MGFGALGAVRSLISVALSSCISCMPQKQAWYRRPWGLWKVRGRRGGALALYQIVRFKMLYIANSEASISCCSGERDISRRISRAWSGPTSRSKSEIPHISSRYSTVSIARSQNPYLPSNKPQNCTKDHPSLVVNPHIIVIPTLPYFL